VYENCERTSQELSVRYVIMWSYVHFLCWYTRIAAKRRKLSTIYRETTVCLAHFKTFRLLIALLTAWKRIWSWTQNSIHLAISSAAQKPEVHAWYVQSCKPGAFHVAVSEYYISALISAGLGVYAGLHCFRMLYDPKLHSREKFH